MFALEKQIEKKEQRKWRESILLFVLLETRCVHTFSLLYICRRGKKNT